MTFVPGLLSSANSNSLRWHSLGFCQLIVSLVDKELLVFETNNRNKKIAGSRLSALFALC